MWHNIMVVVVIALYHTILLNIYLFPLILPGECVFVFYNSMLFATSSNQHGHLQYRMDVSQAFMSYLICETVKGAGNPESRFIFSKPSDATK